MFLDQDTFRGVVAAAPLISIDLIVENDEGELLLGLRKNRPAQDFWFVPGGRVLKNETLDDAFRRISRAELGSELDRSVARFLGVYEHFYDDSVFGETPGTHYIVLAYHVKVNLQEAVLPILEHFSYRWIKAVSAMKDSGVHCYTRAYMKSFCRE